MVRVLNGVLGGVALAAGLGLSSAVAEAEKYTPRIECGDRAPKGKVLYNGKRQQERLGKVVDYFPSPLTGTHFDVYQRAALIKGSNCWVTFWSVDPDDDFDDNTRMTGRFIDPLVYSEGQRDVFGGAFGGAAAKKIIVELDKVAASCVQEQDRIRASYPMAVQRLTDEELAILKGVAEARSVCLETAAKALDQRGFIGLWYSRAQDRDFNFAVLDGKLIVWTEYLGE